MYRVALAGLRAQMYIQNNDSRGQGSASYCAARVCELEHRGDKPRVELLLLATRARISQSCQFTVLSFSLGGTSNKTGGVITGCVYFSTPLTRGGPHGRRNILFVGALRCNGGCCLGKGRKRCVPMFSHSPRLSNSAGVICTVP